MSAPLPTGANPVVLHCITLLCNEHSSVMQRCQPGQGASQASKCPFLLERHYYKRGPTIFIEWDARFSGADGRFRIEQEPEISR